MKVLKVLNPDNVSKESLKAWWCRKAARAVVLNAQDQIGLLHVTSHKYYKLPGGGVEDGEDFKSALHRECQEELGVVIEILSEVGSIIEYRLQHKLHQTSYCYFARTTSVESGPKFSDEESAAGFEVAWVQPQTALELLKLGETTDYEGKFIEQRDYCLLSNALEDNRIL